MRLEDGMDQAAVIPIADPTDQASFEEFFGEHRDELFRALCLLTRNRHEAEEIAQDAFVKLLERWDTMDRVADLSAYLYRTALNLWRSRLRRTARMAKRIAHVTADRDEMGTIDSTDVVVRALLQLPPKQRAALCLVDILDMTSEQAAAAIGIRSSTVRVHLARAREALRAGREDDADEQRP
jgi:RNA polymerase sigma factor (sigma-70 family)